MKFKIFFQLMCICFVGLTAVAKASPLDTIPPPITDFFIPVSQRSVEPVRNPGDFIGRIFTPKPVDWQTRPEAQPITGVTVTIASGPRVGESVTTNPSGYYRFPNVSEDELHLRVEKEHFEPKEVRVHRSRPTILANGDVPNYTRGPQQHPGNILIGHRWPDEVRIILEEILVVHDLLYVEGGRLPEGTDLGGFYSLGVIVLYSYQFADWKDEVGLLGIFAHEIAHAHQHATVSVDGSAWEIHGWRDTPEGRAYEEAQRKDWEQVGKSSLDNIYGDRRGRGGVALTETAAETCAHYWSVDRWGGRSSYGFQEIEAPNRYKWAEKWVPIPIVMPTALKVVSIPDQNLASAIRKALGLGTNAPITQRWLQRLTQLRARKVQIKNLTGLEHATQLVDLALYHNQIQNVKPLEGLTRLQRLYIQDNQIADITPLAKLTQLRLLHLWGNRIRDISALEGLTKLESLWLENNQIRDISPLANLTKLTDLRLKGNPIQDMSPLRTLLNQNPKLKLDIEIPPPSPIVSVGASQRPPMYWMDVGAGTLHSLVGDEVENFLTDVQNVTSLDIDATNGKIYWTEQTEKNKGSIKLANLDGSNVQILATLQSVPTSIAVDTANSKLYWTNSRGKIQLANLNGKPIRNLIQDLKAPSNITLNAASGKLYWTENNGRIQRANLNGKSIQNVASGLDAISGLAIAGNKIYWIEKAGESTGKIGRVNRNGSDFTTLTRLQQAPTSLTIDPAGRKLYWSESAGNIRRANLNGKNIQNVVTGLGDPANIVLGSALATIAAAPTHAAEIPEQTVLLANYPNPFNPETWIPYQLSQPSNVKITIYNARGAVVRQLALGHQRAGTYTDRSQAAHWDGRNALGEPVASGIYFYQLQTDNISSLRKMLILK